MNSCLLFWEVCSILLQAAWFVSAPAAAGKKVLSLCWPPALLPCIPKISRITGFTSLRQKQDSEMCFFPHEWRASCLWVHTVGASRQVNLNGWNLALIPGKRALFLEMLCATYSSLGTIFRPSCHQLAASRWEIQSLAIPFIHSTAFLYIASVIPFRLGCFFQGDMESLSEKWLQKYFSVSLQQDCTSKGISVWNHGPQSAKNASVVKSCYTQFVQKRN